jgi:hypothetical protein
MAGVPNRIYDIAHDAAYAHGKFLSALEQDAAP